MKKDITIPLSYFITFTCYGTWLHGEKLISVDWNHNTPGTEYVSSNLIRYENEKKRMAETPYFLDATKRHIVLLAIEEVCKFRTWVLLAAHIRTNHVHLVIHAKAPPELIMNTVKSYATRSLNKTEGRVQARPRWTRHGSTRYLWKENEVEATIRYVVDEQGEAMAVYENKSRSFVYYSHSGAPRKCTSASS